MRSTPTEPAPTAAPTSAPTAAPGRPAAEAPSRAAPPEAPRQPWRTPRLEVLGDLRGLTLGGSPGGGDSGIGAAVELPFGFNP